MPSSSPEAPIVVPCGHCSLLRRSILTSSTNIILPGFVLVYLSLHGLVCWSLLLLMGFPGGSVVKNPPASLGDESSILGSGWSPGEGNGNPLQYSCLENSVGREPGRLYSMELQKSWSRLNHKKLLLILHLVNAPQVAYLFYYWQAFRLSPVWGFYE